MRKFLTIMTLLVGSFAFGQEDLPHELLGVWVNTDGEVLYINRQLDDVTFMRKAGRKLISRGYITSVDGELHVEKYNNKEKIDEYKLAYFIGNETMVITKPRSMQAWLWTRAK